MIISGGLLANNISCEDIIKRENNFAKEIVDIDKEKDLNIIKKEKDTEMENLNILKMENKSILEKIKNKGKIDIVIAKIESERQKNEERHKRDLALINHNIIKDKMERELYDNQKKNKGEIVKLKEELNLKKIKLEEDFKERVQEKNLKDHEHLKRMEQIKKENEEKIIQIQNQFFFDMKTIDNVEKKQDNNIIMKIKEMANQIENNKEIKELKIDKEEITIELNNKPNELKMISDQLYTLKILNNETIKINTLENIQEDNKHEKAMLELMRIKTIHDYNREKEMQALEKEYEKNKRKLCEEFEKENQYIQYNNNSKLNENNFKLKLDMNYEDIIKINQMNYFEMKKKKMLKKREEKINELKKKDELKKEKKKDEEIKIKDNNTAILNQRELSNELEEIKPKENINYEEEKKLNEIDFHRAIKVNDNDLNLTLVELEAKAKYDLARIKKDKIITLEELNNNNELEIEKNEIEKQNEEPNLITKQPILEKIEKLEQTEAFSLLTKMLNQSKPQYQNQYLYNYNINNNNQIIHEMNNKMCGNPFLVYNLNNQSNFDHQIFTPMSYPNVQ